MGSLSASSKTKKAPAKSAVKVPVRPMTKEKAVLKVAGAAKGVSAAPKGVVGTSKVTEAEKMKLIAEAAYFKAEARGWQGGSEAEDWLQAEREVSAALKIKRG
jgi:hypothetical protein